MLVAPALCAMENNPETKMEAGRVTASLFSMNSKRLELWIETMLPKRHFRRKLSSGAYFKSNWYWVKRAVRVLKTHRHYQKWVITGNQCSAPCSHDPMHVTETLDELVSVFDRLGHWDVI